MELLQSAPAMEGLELSSKVSTSKAYEVGGRDATCLLYTSDAADERSSVDLGGRRIIKKKKNKNTRGLIVGDIDQRKVRAHTLDTLTQ